jgi:MoaA/NifB/PqqE/SkfB family radical SAM enzyme
LTKGGILERFPFVVLEHPSLAKRLAPQALLAQPYVQKYVNDATGATVVPNSAQLDLTYHCNLKCAMCPQAHDLAGPDSRITANRRELKQLGLTEWKIVIDKLKSAGVKTIVLSGGEPFLLPFAPDLIRYIRKDDIVEVIVSTNATQVTPEVAKVIVENKVERVGVSIDGPREVHDAIRGRHGAFDDAIRGLKHLLSAKAEQKSLRPDLSINCTFSALNYTVIEHIPAIAADLGVKSVISALNYFNGDCDPRGPVLVTKGENRILPDELREINIGELKKSLKRFREAAARSDYPACMGGQLSSEDEIIRWYQDPSYSYTTRCLAPWDFLNVDPFGRLVMCMIGDCTGNLLEQSVEEALNGEEYRAFRRHLRSRKLFSFCSRCCLLNNRAWCTIRWDEE